MKMVVRGSVRFGYLLSWKYVLIEICVYIFVIVKLKLDNIINILKLKIDLMKKFRVRNIFLKNRGCS